MKTLHEDPARHQRDVGEREPHPPQDQSRAGEGEALEAQARRKAAKNNKDRHDQTGEAIAAAQHPRRAER